MNLLRYSVLPLACLVMLYPAPGATAGLGGLLDSVKQAVGGGGLSGDEIVQGLKEALKIGSGNAVTTVSKLDGYYGNSAIKIPLPGAVQKAEKMLRLAGYGDKLDAFELSMNRAAERAAPEAKALFWDAVKQMQFADAKKILNGRDNEATLFFKDKTYGRLQEIFKPIVGESMGEVGVTAQYRDLNNRLAQLPLADRLSLDLDQYVTDRGLDGLFHMLAIEEQKIRQDPAARVTDLLKKVFSRRQ